MSKHPASAGQKPHAGRPAYELRDVNLLWITGVGALVMVTVAVCYVASWLVYDALQRPSSSDAAAYITPPGEDASIPTPRLEGINRMAEFIQTGSLAPRPSAAQQRLASYGWVDRQARIVHIPIDRAIQTVLDNHLLPAAKADDLSSEPRPSSANSGRPPRRSP